MAQYQGQAPKAGGGIIIVPEGKYLLTVAEAKEGRSTNGNPLIELKCKIANTGALLWDNLVFTEKAFWKIDQFRAATGDDPSQDTGEVIIDEDYCTGRQGYAMVGIETIPQGKNAGKRKNVLLYWIFDEEAQSRVEPQDPGPDEPQQAEVLRSNVGVPTKSANPKPPGNTSTEPAKDDIPF